MTTGTDVAGLPQPQESEGPPIVEVGVLGWMRENLFGSVPSTILTLVGVYLVYALIRSILNFIPESF